MSKLETAPAGARRAAGRLESRNFPRRVRADDEPLTRSALIANLEAANAVPAPPASQPPEVSAAAAAGLSPQAALDLANGVHPQHSLRHRSGGV
jgi:hypothetical protein